LPAGATRGYTVWDRARNPKLSKYCTLLARGYAKLGSAAEQALKLAGEARKTLPGRPAPWVLEARALLAQGDPKKAFVAFEKARKLDEAFRLPPAALHDYGLCAAKTGNREAALSAYRRLVPMAGLLTGPGHRERIYVEAALLVMVLDPGSVQEAAAYLLEARRGNVLPSMKPFILGALALALDRQGRSEEARGVASEVRGIGALSQLAEALDSAPQASGPSGLQLFGHELLAMIALVAQAEDREVAREYWQQYVDSVGDGAPWAGHAKSHLTRASGRR
jgi:tetratricopeptide (TPR) repeat protein